MDKTKTFILVVEDEPSLQEAITKKLESLDFSVKSFESGKQALDYLLSLSSVNKFPDLIWLDFYVKEMSGLEFMKELKNHDQLAAIPIIVVSNSASPEKVNQMMSLGAKKYLLKAENRLDDIIDMIHEVIKK